MAAPVPDMRFDRVGNAGDQGVNPNSAKPCFRRHSGTCSSEESSCRTWPLSNAMIATFERCSATLSRIVRPFRPMISLGAPPRRWPSWSSVLHRPQLAAIPATAGRLSAGGSLAVSYLRVAWVRPGGVSAG